MKKKFLVVGILGVLLIGCVFVLNKYSIPQLIPEDYNCDEHPGFIFNSNPAPFESQQHYVNRHRDAVKKQIEEMCD